eukprot:786745-Pelagomonas_calceolata.AAC.1
MQQQQHAGQCCGSGHTNHPPPFSSFIQTKAWALLTLIMKSRKFRDACSRPSSALVWSSTPVCCSFEHGHADTPGPSLLRFILALWYRWQVAISASF